MRLNNGENWEPTEADMALWELTYTGINVGAEIRKMTAWLDANPARRKTKRGIKRFVVGWLSKARPNASTSTRSTSLADDLNDTSWAN